MTKKLQQLEQDLRYYEGILEEGEGDDFENLISDAYEYGIMEMREIRKDGMGQILGYELTIVYGGPTITVNTYTGTIDGSFQSEKASMGLSFTASENIENAILGGDYV